MNTWLIYEPPGGAARTLEDAERFVSLREGFSKAAFLFPFVWLIWRRCWLALALYLAAAVALALVAGLLSLRSGEAILLALLPNLAVGFEAAWLRARSLERRGYRFVAALMARSRDEAEAHFFAEWSADAHDPAPAPRPTAGPVAAYRPAAAGVLGLFPQPGAAR
ncbi:DUF2628 domain-containing protein [Methylopila turkensis]|uniref:DUF2628 domain-containing protein n=1 Tax=Methylopila turkensis TaxID=1437816 RepID=A0A9W6JKW1_9HYPH|nr:DUF2628 domain-containing protein [Methylopila turkensis]GLK79531.1 hypothetical protein GCM10008174_12720 [Methylopila turkensis]